MKLITTIISIISLILFMNACGSGIVTTDIDGEDWINSEYINEFKKEFWPAPGDKDCPDCPRDPITPGCPLCCYANYFNNLGEEEELLGERTDTWLERPTVSPENNNQVSKLIKGVYGVSTSVGMFSSMIFYDIAPEDDECDEGTEEEKVEENDIVLIKDSSSDTWETVNRLGKTVTVNFDEDIKDGRVNIDLYYGNDNSYCNGWVAKKLEWNVGEDTPDGDKSTFRFFFNATNCLSFCARFPEWCKNEE